MSSPNPHEHDRSDSDYGEKRNNPNSPRSKAIRRKMDNVKRKGTNRPNKIKMIKGHAVFREGN